MRNFKLLLATTAILSTTLTANVWADDPITTTMKVKMGVMAVDKLYVEQDLDFGHFIKGGVVQATLNPVTGGLSASADIVQGSNAHQGIVSIAFQSDSPKTLSLPSSVKLQSSIAGKTPMVLTPTFGLINKGVDTDKNSAKYGIGGSVAAESGWMSVDIEGIYTGELTITAIEDTGV